MKRRQIMAAACIWMLGMSAVMPIQAEEAAWLQEAEGEAPEVDGQACIGEAKLDYAEGFAIYYYENGCKVLSVKDGRDYLIVPEDVEVTGEMEDTFIVLQKPLENVYLAATSAMSLIAALDCTDHITLTGTDVSGWNIQPPIDALESGQMTFAGRYSEPDYELLVGNDCQLAIESTMISHSPEVQEMLEDIDISVFIDRSSYEVSGLGRTEWIKAYGALFDTEEKAYEKFEEQEQVLDDMENYEDTGKTVVYFSISTDGACVVRRPDDYISTMIQDAGGTYIFNDIDVTGGGATVDISMEEFYSKAVDADYLVYNGTITGSMDGKEALLDKSELFTDFKAYQEGNLWQVDSSLYQSTDKVAQLIRDFHIMMTDGPEEQLTFLQKIK